MKKFKKFLSLTMLLIVTVLAFSFLGGTGLISKAANKLDTPYVDYAYANIDGNVTVSFSPVKKATKYRVYRKTANSSWTKVADTTKSRIVDKTAKKDVTYYYTVKANYVSKSKSYWSSYDKIGVKSVNKYPQTPTLNSATASANGISISWNASNRSSKYIVYRKTEKSDWKRLGVTSNTTYIDKVYTPNTVYYYTIKAYKTIDNVDYYSNYVKSGISCVSYYPAMPKLNLALSTAAGVHVTWNKVEGATSYIVLRKTSDGDWDEIETTTGNCYIDKTAKDFSVYYYTIQAVNNVNGRNYYSSYNTQGIIMGRLKSEFEITSIELNYLNMPTIKWTKFENAEGYLVYRKLTAESDANYKLIKKINRGSREQFTDFDVFVDKNTSYTYVVKPYFAEMSNTGYYAISTIDRQTGESKTNIEPNPVPSASNPESNNNSSKKNNNSAQEVFDTFISDKYAGKTVSIIGDSISTYEGYNDGNHYYPANDVTSVDKTWWKRSADALGMKIANVNTLSGRRLTTTKVGNTSAVERCLNVKSSNGKSPDVIISFIGVNDYINNVKLGKYTSDTVGITSMISENTDIFINAYAVMINRLQQKYPNAEIILCTIPKGCVQSINDNGDSVNQWNVAIKDIAKGFGLKTICFEKSNYDRSTAEKASCDYSANAKVCHPNTLGHKYLADKVINTLK